MSAGGTSSTPAPPPKLRRGHPCSAAFLDETGVIAKDRFFGVGVMKAEEPSRLLRAVQKFRDKKHWYGEIKFSDLKPRALDLYKELVDLALDPAYGARYFCFMADRHVADPVARFGSQWDAYGKLAEQLLVAVTQPYELVSVMADNYSTPDHVLFEEDLRAAVNRRLHRLAMVSVCRLDSKSSDGLQIVDLLTSAVAHEFRSAAGIASPKSGKGQLADHVRAGLGTTSCLAGWRNDTHSVQVYDHGAWSPDPSQSADPPLTLANPY